MSLQFDANLNCNVCGNSFDAKLYKTIWGEIPENRRLVMSDQINVVTCPHCGNSSHVASSLFYTNSKQEFAVWYEPYHDPMIDSDTEGYKKFGGPNCYFATAPRIKDWEDFKDTIRKFEDGEFKGGRPNLSSVLKGILSNFKK